MWRYQSLALGHQLFDKRPSLSRDSLLSDSTSWCLKDGIYIYIYNIKLCLCCSAFWSMLARIASYYMIIIWIEHQSVTSAESKVHEPNMETTWVLSAPDGLILAQWTLLSGSMWVVGGCCDVLPFYGIISASASPGPRKNSITGCHAKRMQILWTREDCKVAYITTDDGIQLFYYCRSF